MASSGGHRSSKWVLPKLDGTKLLQLGDRLSAAVEESNEDEFRRLLRSRPDLNGCLDKRGLSPLHVAVIERRHKMVSTLLHYRESLRLDVNIRSTSPGTAGLTALQFAVMGKNTKAVRMLVKHGGNVKELITACMATFQLEDCKHCYCGLSTFVRIHELTCQAREASSHLSFENPPQSLQENDFSKISELMPTGSPNPLRLLLCSGSVIPYTPAGSSTTRYCFPACLPQKLPESIWQTPSKYGILAGRFLVPLCVNTNLTSLLHQLLVQLLNNKPVSEHNAAKNSFHFLLHSTESLVRITRKRTRRGILILIRSRKMTGSNFTCCCDTLNHIIKSLQQMTDGGFECAVVSNCDLRKNELHPHIYSSSEVSQAIESEQVFLLHPTKRQEESFCSLLLKTGEECLPEPRAGTPTKASALSSLEERPLVRRKLNYHISDVHWESTVYEQAVQKCYGDLTKYLHLEPLIPPLVEAHHLTAEEAGDILLPTTPTHQSVRLLAKLERKGRDAYDTFLQALKDSEVEYPVHGEMRAKLLEKCDEITTSRPLFEECTGIYTEDYESVVMPPLGSFRSNLQGSDRPESGFHSMGAENSSFGSNECTPVHTSADSGNPVSSRSAERRPAPTLRVHPNAKTNVRASDFGSSLNARRLIFPPLSTNVHKQPVRTGPPTKIIATRGHDPQNHGFHTVQHVTNACDEILNFEMSELYPDEEVNPPVLMGDEVRSYSVANPPRSPRSLGPNHVRTVPIDVPSRNASSNSLLSLAEGKRPSSRRSSSQSDSTETSSSPPSSDSLTDSFWSLSSSVKDLSAIAPEKSGSFGTSLKEFFRKIFSPETDEKVHNSNPDYDLSSKYLLGYGFRM